MLTITRVLTSMLLPQSCAVCAEPLSDADYARPYPLCAQCRSLPTIAGDLCSRCGRPLISESEHCMKCRASEMADTQHSNRALYIYTGLTKRLIWSYKFSYQKRLSRFFAEQIYPLLPQQSDFALVPIPGAPKNVRRRGWDQMAVIARALRIHYQVPSIDLLVHRSRRSQKSLDRQARQAHAATTFALRRRITLPPSLRAAILLDDVYTTGATVQSCAEIIRTLGISQASSITLSIAW